MKYLKLISIKAYFVIDFLRRLFPLECYTLAGQFVG